MKYIETITIEGAMHSYPWRKHEPNEVVRVEMDYYTLQWCCYLLQLINKTVADSIEYDLIYGIKEEAENELTAKEAMLILNLDQIKRAILKDERDTYYNAAIEKAIWALKMVGEKTQLSEEDATN